MALRFVILLCGLALLACSDPSSDDALHKRAEEQKGATAKAGLAKGMSKEAEAKDASTQSDDADKERDEEDKQRDKEDKERDLERDREDKLRDLEEARADRQRDLEDAERDREDKQRDRENKEEDKRREEQQAKDEAQRREEDEERDAEDAGLQPSLLFSLVEADADADVAALRPQMPSNLRQNMQKMIQKLNKKSQEEQALARKDGLHAKEQMEKEYARKIRHVIADYKHKAEQLAKSTVSDSSSKASDKDDETPPGALLLLAEADADDWKEGLSPKQLSDLKHDLAHLHKKSQKEQALAAKDSPEAQQFMKQEYIRKIAHLLKAYKKKAEAASSMQVSDKKHEAGSSTQEEDEAASSKKEEKKSTAGNEPEGADANASDKANAEPIEPILLAVARSIPEASLLSVAAMSVAIVGVVIFAVAELSKLRCFRNRGQIALLDDPATVNIQA